MTLGRNLENGTQTEYTYNALYMRTGNRQTLAGENDPCTRDVSYLPDFLSRTGNELVTCEKGKYRIRTVFGRGYERLAGIVAMEADPEYAGMETDRPGAGVNGAIAGGVHGALIGSGVGIGASLALDFAAGTAGSAAEQWIGTGSASVKESLKGGLTNAVTGRIYGTGEIKSAGSAFLRGAAAGGAASGSSYLSEALTPRPGRLGRSGVSGLAGMMLAGAAVAAGRDPRRGCAAGVREDNQAGPRMAYGYQYGVSQPAEKKSGFSLADFGKEVLAGEVTGGLASTAFYGAGKVVQALTGSVRSNKGSTVPEELVHVYRGADRYSEINTYERKGHLMSDATRELYYETGNLNEAYAKTNSVHNNWLKIWENENDYIQAHGEFGTELSDAFGLKRTFMSVTTDVNVAQRFAGADGRVFEAYIPKNQLIEQTLSGAGESEYLIKSRMGGFRW